MRQLFQPGGSKLCGQTCVAMIADVSIEKAIELVGHGHRTRTKEIVKALRKAGVECKGGLVKISSKNRLPETCLVNVLYDKNHRHWIVKNDGVFYNPDPGEGGRMTSFLEISRRGEENGDSIQV